MISFIDTVEVAFDGLLLSSLGGVFLAETVVRLVDLVGSSFSLLFRLDFVGFDLSSIFLFLS